MKKFADELKNGPVMIDKDCVTDTPIYDEGTLIGHFKNWKSPEYVSKLKQRNEQLDRENLALRDKIANLEAQQPEIPEVPQFVADWLEYCKEMQVSLYFAVTYFIKVDSGKITEGSSSHDDYGFGVSEENSKLVREWFTSDVHNQEKLAFAFITNFYTVKVKRFYLKHKSVIVYDCNCGCGNSDTDELYLMADGNFAIFKEDAYKFTQSQIDSMETGSYERILIEEN